MDLEIFCKHFPQTGAYEYQELIKDSIKKREDFEEYDIQMKEKCLNRREALKKLQLIKDDNVDILSSLLDEPNTQNISLQFDDTEIKIDNFNVKTIIEGKCDLIKNITKVNSSSRDNDIKMCKSHIGDSTCIPPSTAIKCDFEFGMSDIRKCVDEELSTFEEKCKKFKEQFGGIKLLDNKLKLLAMDNDNDNLREIIHDVDEHLTNLQQFCVDSSTISEIVNRNVENELKQTDIKHETKTFSNILTEVIIEMEALFYNPEYKS